MISLVGVKTQNKVFHPECAPKVAALSPIFEHEEGIEDLDCYACGYALVDIPGPEPELCPCCGQPLDAYAEDSGSSYCSYECALEVSYVY